MQKGRCAVKDHPDQITSEEQSAIDAWLAKNKPQVIPQGQVYYDVTTEIGWMRQRDMGFKAYERQKKFENAGKNEEIAKIRDLAAKCCTDSEIGEAIGKSPKEVFRIRKRNGIASGFAKKIRTHPEMHPFLKDWIGNQELLKHFPMHIKGMSNRTKEMYEEGILERRKVGYAYQYRLVQTEVSNG